jgi:hypothetical protein
MTEWYEKGYIGKSPPVQVNFPRPLYPPDAKAKGKTPSKDGPDVLAYKRAICHAGRWGPWAPDTWDDTFSNAFSHGKGTGNLKDSGIAGFQRQQGLDPTGWVGQKTFDNMRYATISDPKAPHFGEPILDQVCVGLLNEAYAIYQGQVTPPPPPPPPTPQKTPRQIALDHMQKRLGYTENPANSNCDDRSDGIRTAQDHTANGTWLRYQPWCGCWCFYAMEAAGVKNMDSSLASVSQIQQYARSASKCYKGWTNDRSRVKPGDLVTMGGAAHVEMVRGFDGSNTLTYGGNTSAGTSGSQSNGGGAYARTRYPGEIDGYALVRYPGE